MHFEREYFHGIQYSLREDLVRRCVFEIIKWGSKVSGIDLLDGRGKTALDVGCAYGYAANVLTSLKYDAAAIDISKFGVRCARKNSEAQILSCDVQTRLPFGEKSFDLVTCFDVLEHLTNPFGAINNMFDVCRGIVLCASPNSTVEKPIRKLIGDLDKTHVNTKAPQEWRSFIQKSLESRFTKVETFYDLNLRVAQKLLFFKSVKVPYLGLTVRMLIRR